MDNDKIAAGARICRKKGELRLEARLVEKLADFVSTYQLKKHFRKGLKARLPLAGKHFLHEVFSAPQLTFIEWARALDLSVPCFDTNTDLEKGRYEGGFKVWEATADLVRFVDEDENCIGKLLQKNEGLEILELGCGAGLASITFISRLIAHETFDSDYIIHMQDFNWSVLATVTLLNLAFNLPTDYLAALVRTRSLRFFLGDWGEFQGKSRRYQYDLIMMSETIYEAQNFNHLHDLLDKHLKQDGIIVIATKDTYFGLSGGLYSWLDFVAENDSFTMVKLTKVNQNSIPRSILVLRRS